MIITGRARLAGVAGWPVSHSLSPRLHNHWFERYAIDGAYIPLAVRPDDFASLIRSLAKSGFMGVNVTIPHKLKAFEICDERHPLAEITGAVNTILFQEDGRLSGLNTDLAGFKDNLDHQASGWQAHPGHTLLLGAGGAGRAVAFALLDSGVTNLVISNRNKARAHNLEDELKGHFDAHITVIGWQERHEGLKKAGLVVNATSLGMEGQEPLELLWPDRQKEEIRPVAADLVYKPLKTDFLNQALLHGFAPVDGLGMLIYQAVPGFCHWGGLKPQIDQTTWDLMLA